MPSSTVQSAVGKLIDHKYKIALIESATSGRIASEISLVKESGKVLLGGIVCYDVRVKTDLLKIPQIFIDKYTPESAEVTQALAENLRVYFKADIIVAVTGLASPGGSETEQKPVGTMFIHMLTPYGFVSHREKFDGDPEEIVIKTVDKVCELIVDKIHT
ncbi:MAG TPA: CinA family protein [Flavobacterium sp.]|jgi:nicotinamide-nucleotide amidase